MKIIYYSGVSNLAHAIHIVESLSEIAEVHFVIGIQRGYSQGSIIDINTDGFKSGIYNGKDFFKKDLPESFYFILRKLSGFWVVYHPHPSFQHPFAWSILWKEMSFLKSLKADVLHLDGIVPNIARTIFRYHQPVFWTIHDAKPHIGEKSWRNNLWINLIKRKVSHYIVHSEFTKKQLLEHGNIDNNNITVVTFGLFSIFKEWDNKKVNQSDKTILFFGRLSPYKGIEVLLEAMQIVSEELSNIRLVIAGQLMSWYKMPIIPILKNNCEIIIKTDYITNSDLCDLFNDASICVLPYLDASQSGILVMSFAFNTPVIASNIGGMAEYIDHEKTGLLVEPGDRHSLAEAIVILSDNVALRNKMRDNISSGKTKILSWESIAKILLESYRLKNK